MEGNKPVGRTFNIPKCLRKPVQLYANQPLHQTANPLRSLAASDPRRYTKNDLWIGKENFALLIVSPGDMALT